MGLTVSLAVLRKIAAVPDGWAPCPGPVPGWTALAERKGVPVTELGPVGPSLRAFVQDSDTAEVWGLSGAREVFRWRTSATVPAGLASKVCDWAAEADVPAPDPAQLAAILDGGWLLAEEGVVALLVALGIVPGDGALTIPAGLRDTAPPQPRVFEPVPIAFADPAALPRATGRVLLAAPIRHDGSRWDRFVRWYELEDWGEPPCIVADSGSAIAPGQIASWQPWTIYLASDPPFELTEEFWPLARCYLPDIGPWTVIPVTGVPQAVAWARDNVGRAGAPPSPDRAPLTSELEPGPVWGHRTAHPQSGFELFTGLPVDPGSVAEWIAEVRDTILAPVAALFGDGVTVEASGKTGPPYGARVTLSATTAEGRHSWRGAGARSWSLALNQVRRGEIRELAVGLENRDGMGELARHNRLMLRFRVSLHAGGEPSEFSLSISRPLVKRALSSSDDAILDLTRRTAARFGATPREVR